MKCNQCGNDIEQSAKFCGSCGQPVMTTAPPPQQSTIPPQSPQPPTQQPIPVQQNQQVQQTQPPQPQTNNFATGYAQAATLPAQLPQNAQPAMAGNTGAAPAYPVASNNGGKAVASLILAVLAIPGTLIPIIGLVLGVLAVIFGTLSTKSPRRGLAIGGTVVGIIAVILSLMVFAYALSNPPKSNNAYGSNLNYMLGSEQTTTPTSPIDHIWGAATSDLLR